MISQMLGRGYPFGPTDVVYSSSHIAGVVSLVVAAGLSGFAVWVVFLAVTVRSPTYHNTHVVAYFISLLIANELQAAGTAMNAKWVLEKAVEDGVFCSLQGGVKQAGNVGMALWSFMLAMHLFNLLFLRWKSTNLGRNITLLVGWFAVAFIVSIGPIAIQKKDKGPYFGPSGYWCWITNQYPREQKFLEYFFEFLSAGLSFILYTAILLRVSGNIILDNNGRWQLRFVPRGESWQLAISRDLIDSSMLQVAARMVWYPVAYTVLLLPISLTRLITFGGGEVPFWATMLADFIFNLQGLVNVVLLLSTRRLIPDTATMPVLTTPRKAIDPSSSEAAGITPYILPPKEFSSQPSSISQSHPGRPVSFPVEYRPTSRFVEGVSANDDPELGLYRSESSISNETTDSVDSSTPIVQKPMLRLYIP